MTTDFLNELDQLLKDRIVELSNQIRGDQNPNVKVPPMPKLLMAALKNEWETSLLTSHWVTDEKNVDLRIDLARLAGDEAKHFSLIEERLKNLGGSKVPEELNKRTPLFHFLMEQKNSFERAVTGPFAREALAVARNEVFLEHCQQIKDIDTIKLYETIQKDEAHHHQLGRKYVGQMINNQDDFEFARSKVLAVLDVVDEIQEMAVMQLGICRLPGC